MMIDLVIILFLCFTVTSSQRNNACYHMEDYNFIKTSKNCFYNPDADLTVPEIITTHGYPLETYHVVTKDGYILQLFRIPYGKNSLRNENEILQPVLLQHGIFVSAAQFVASKNRSLGFIMADKGYDVWLANTRGTTYSKGHIRFSVEDSRYWNYSFTDMGIYDTAEILNTIYKVTRRNDTIMIGHSMGTTIQLVYGSMLPDHAKNRVKFMVYMSPAVFMGTLDTILRYSPILLPLLEEEYKILGSSEFFFAIDKLPKNFLNNVCLKSSIQIDFCLFLAFSIIGSDYENFAYEDLSAFFNYYPTSTSTKTLIHFGQDIKTNKFSQFDYGPEINMRYYQTEKAPSFNLSRIETPGLIMYGANDRITNPQDASELEQALPKDRNELYQISDPKYNHFDFYLAENVNEEVFIPMLKIIEKYKVTLTK